MTRVATYAQHLLTKSYFTDTQARLKDAQIQLASGKVAQSYDKLGISSFQLVTLEGKYARAEQFSDNVDRALGRMDMMESTMATLAERATYLQGQLSTALSGTNADDIALEAMASGFLKEVASLLNLEHEGRYLFAGSKGDVAPVDASSTTYTATFDVGDATTADAFSIRILGANNFQPVTVGAPALPPADGNALAAAVNAELTAAGVTGATASWVGGATNGKLVITETQGRPIGAASLTAGGAGVDPDGVAIQQEYFRGDSIEAVVRADEGFEVSYGSTADEPGFEKLVRALSYVAWAGGPNVDPSERDEALTQAFDLTKKAIDGIAETRSALGASYSVLEAAKQGHQDFLTYSGNAISGIEDADVAEVMTRIAADETQLQASYITISRLSSVSLIDFLR